MKFQILEKMKIGKIVKFEILNPSSTHNLKSLTLIAKTPILRRQLPKLPKRRCIKIKFLLII